MSHSGRSEANDDGKCTQTSSEKFFLCVFYFPQPFKLTFKKLKISIFWFFSRLLLAASLMISIFFFLYKELEIIISQNTKRETHTKQEVDNLCDLNKFFSCVLNSHFASYLTNSLPPL